MFLPVTMDSAERIVETIQEIKQKIPSDPYEAELILMAEMVAEGDENNDKPETGKEEKAVKKAAEKQEAPVTDGEMKHLMKPWKDEREGVLGGIKFVHQWLSREVVLTYLTRLTKTKEMLLYLVLEMHT